MTDSRRGTDGNPRTEATSTGRRYHDPPSGLWLSPWDSRAAARKVSERIFGDGRHAITLSHPGIPDVTLHYTNFEDITEDVDDARVYGGIHFRYDQEAGGKQGRRVGAYVYEHNLRPARQDHDRD